MTFCPNCGKPLEDGQVCSCQQMAPVAPAVAPVAPVAPAAPAADPSSTQSKINETAAAASAAAAKVGAQASEAAKESYNSAFEIFNDPAAGVKKFIESASWARTIVLAAIQFVVAMIFRIIGYIKYNNNVDMKEIKKAARALDMSVDKYCKKFGIDTGYDFGDILKLEIKNLITLAAVFAVLAVLIWLFAKVFGKVVISWNKAFAIATVTTLVAIPCIAVNGILGLIPSFKLIDYIMSAVATFRSVAGYLLIFLALDSQVKDTKKTVYTMIVALVACDVADSLVRLILNSLLNF